MRAVVRDRAQGARSAHTGLEEPPVTIPVGLVYRVCWLLLSVAVVVPIFIVRYAPMYDYHQWVYQGRIVSDLVFSHPDGRSVVSGTYSLSQVPVPNSAAPALLALLTAWVS